MNTIRTIGVAALLATSTLLLAQTPEATPPPTALVLPPGTAITLTPAQQAFQDNVLGWVSVAEKLWPFFAAAFTWLITEIITIKGRLNRQAANTGQMQNQLTNVALAAGVPTVVTPLPADATKPSAAPLITTVTALVLTFAAACSTTGPDPARNARNAGLNAAGSAAMRDGGKILTGALANFLLTTVQAEATGQKIDYLQAAAAGAWSQANATTTSALIADTITAYSAGKATNTAMVAKAAADLALKNGEHPAAVASAIAAVIATGAGTPPAK